MPEMLQDLERVTTKHNKLTLSYFAGQAGMFLWLRMLRPRRFTLEELLESREPQRENFAQRHKGYPQHEAMRVHMQNTRLLLGRAVLNGSVVWGY